MSCYHSVVCSDTSRLLWHAHAHCIERLSHPPVNDAIESTGKVHVCVLAVCLHCSTHLCTAQSTDSAQYAQGMCSVEL